MSDDVKMVISGTFAILTLAWVLTNASAVQSVTGAAASSYATAVGALKPGTA
jgi:hypothetical protein